MMNTIDTVIIVSVKDRNKKVAIALSNTFILVRS